MKDYVECPTCEVRYPWKRIYSGRRDQPVENRVHYTKCAVCGCVFEYSISARRRFRIGPKVVTSSRPRVVEEARPDWDTRL